MKSTAQISVINNYINRKTTLASQSAKGKMKRRKTDDQYKKELKECNQFIEALEPYVDARTPILHRCLKHNVEWKLRPYDALRGKGCRQCGREKISQKAQKTTEWYISELKRKEVPVIPLEEYKGIYTSIQHQCLIDGSVFDGIPSYLLSRKTGCYQCSQKKKRTPEQYESELMEIAPFIHPLELFTGMNDPILHYCDKHDVTWMANPGNIIYQKCGCPECGKDKIGEKNKMTHEEYVRRLHDINPYIEAIEQYIDSYTPILHLCKTCGHEWRSRPYNILSGKGCPICCESIGERKIRQWLDKNQIRYERQKIFDDCKDQRCLPFDYFLPDYNKCIEYDGIQHFIASEFFGGEDAFRVRKKHDQIKTQYCLDHNISLLRISYNQDITDELKKFLFI